MTMLQCTAEAVLHPALTSPPLADGLALTRRGMLAVPVVLPAAFAMRLIALIDDAQAIQREQVVDFANVLGAAAHQARQTAGCHHRNVFPKLGDQPLENPIDQPEIAVIEARLHAVD